MYWNSRDYRKTLTREGWIMFNTNSALEQSSDKPIMIRLFVFVFKIAGLTLSCFVAGKN